MYNNNYFINVDINQLISKYAALHSDGGGCCLCVSTNRAHTHKYIQAVAGQSK